MLERVAAGASERGADPTDFPIVRAIRRYAEQLQPIVHWSEFDRGGHFAALEAPDLITGDIRTFFQALR